MIALLLLGLLAPLDLRQAEREYRAGRFAVALEHFEAALASPDAPRGAVLYDMGNCAYRLGHHAEAVWHYRRAARLLPHDPEVRFNLELARRELGLAPSPRSRLSGALAPFDALAPWARLALVGAVQILALAGAALVRRRVLRAGLVGLALLGLLGAARLARDAWYDPPPEGVVLASAALREEPAADSPITVELRPGETVRVAAVDDAWIEVESPLGRGWTGRAEIGVVD